jgi:hypothetical protein
LCLAVDAWQYSRRSTRDQAELQNALVQAIAAAARQAGLDRSSWIVQKNGDGQLVVVPTSGDEPALVGRFVPALDEVLGTYNAGRTPEARLRLRVAIHHGDTGPGSNGLTGAGPVDVSRLLDSIPVREALAVSAASNLALIVSTPIFDDTIRQGHTTVPGPDDFVRVKVVNKAKAFEREAWVWVPGLGRAELKQALDNKLIAYIAVPAEHLDQAWAGVEDASSPRYSEIRRLDDGLLVRFTDEVVPEHIVGRWIESLRATVSSGPRLSVGIHRASDVDHAIALARSAPARTAMATKPDADLVLVVSDQVYDTVVSGGGPFVRPESYGPVDVGGPAWMRIPAYGRLPSLPDSPPEASSGKTGRRSAPGMNIGTVHGDAAMFNDVRDVHTFVVGTNNAGPVRGQ